MVDHHKRLQAALPPEVKEASASSANLNTLTHQALIFKKEGVYWIDGSIMRIAKDQTIWALRGAYIKKLADKDYPL